MFKAQPYGFEIQDIQGMKCMNLKKMSNKNSTNMFFDVFLGEMLLWFKHNSRDNEKKSCSCSFHVHEKHALFLFP